MNQLVPRDNWLVAFGPFGGFEPRVWDYQSCGFWPPANDMATR